MLIWLLLIGLVTLYQFAELWIYIVHPLRIKVNLLYHGLQENITVGVSQDGVESATIFTRWHLRNMAKLAAYIACSFIHCSLAGIWLLAGHIRRLHCFITIVSFWLIKKFIWVFKRVVIICSLFIILCGGCSLKLTLSPRSRIENLTGTTGLASYGRVEPLLFFIWDDWHVYYIFYLFILNYN